jgi:hypothetical protein
VLGVGVEDASQNIIELICQGKDSLEEILRASISSVGRVLKGSLLPWVASASEINQDNSQTPDVIGGTHVVWFPCRRIQALWAHVKGRATSVILGAVFTGGQSKVGELDGLSIVGDKDVLRLEVPVVDPQVMAVLDGIQDLKEHLLGEFVLTNILTTLCDVQEEIALRAVLENNIDAVRVVHNL